MTPKARPIHIFLSFFLVTTLPAAQIPHRLQSGDLPDPALLAHGEEMQQILMNSVTTAAIGPAMRPLKTAEDR
jgi:hypothetical protein